MKVLVLKSVAGDGSARGGFVWPAFGKVVCPNWNPVAKRGSGFHGLLWGEGNSNLLNQSKDARWLVLEVESEKIVELDRKVKFSECEIVYCGERDVAIGMILERNPGAACCFAKKVIENDGRVIVGDFGIVTAGDYGKAIAGDYGTATAENCGQAIAGYGGKATVGKYGQAIAGYDGIATAGERGQAMVGEYGKAQCGENGWIEIEYWNEKRYRVLVGYAGEEIEANVMYAVIEESFVRVL